MAGEMILTEPYELGLDAMRTGHLSNIGAQS